MVEMQARAGEREFGVSGEGLQDFASKVMGEHLADFNSVGEATTTTKHLSRDFGARFLLERDLYLLLNKADFTPTKRTFSVGIFL